MLPLLQDEKCREDKCTTGATCTGCVTLPSKNETALKIAVGSIGPISVGIDASEGAFQVRAYLSQPCGGGEWCFVCVQPFGMCTLLCNYTVAHISLSLPLLLSLPLTLPQLYKKGVYDPKHCSKTQLDHGVLAVGYGTEDGKDYWLVKNR